MRRERSGGLDNEGNLVRTSRRARLASLRVTLAVVTRGLCDWRVRILEG